MSFLEIIFISSTGRQGPAGPPGHYDPTLDEISSGPIGPQGEIGPQGDIGVPGIPGEVGRRGSTGDQVFYMSFLTNFFTTHNNIIGYAWRFRF